jgi:hypothetical protein
MDRPVIDIDSLPPEVRKRLGKQVKVKRKRVSSMTLNEVRTYAIRALNVMADLAPSDRRRVLRQAARMNDV